MVETRDRRHGAGRRLPAAGRVMWLGAAVCWAGALVLAVHVFQPRRFLRLRFPVAERSVYATVAAVVEPLALRLEDGRTVRPAGVTVPETWTEAARKRLAEISGPGTRVYVEPAGGTSGPGPEMAMVWLPGEGADEGEPFAYEKARLVAAVLVAEGWARADAELLYRYREELVLLEGEARRHGRGQWGAGEGGAGVYVDRSGTRRL